MADRKTPRRTSPKAAPPARRPISAGWAAAILAILVAIFFHEVLVGGQTFTSPDAMAPAGFVRMGEQSLWQDHVYPLWNPFVFLGMPSFASGAYNPLIYPPDWPLALVQRVLPLPEMTWLILYYAFGAWAFFLLAREWGARAEGALVGAIAFIFAPNLIAVGSHGHGSQLVDSAYLPFMLWLATRWLRGGKLEWLGMLAIAGGFQMLRGHVQVCFYTWLAIALYAAAVVALPPRGPDAAPRAQPVPRALALAAAAALAFGIAGLYNLPLQDYSHLSMRGAGEGGGIGMERATMWSLAPIELPTIVVPGWAGFGGQTYWGGMPFTDYPNAYVGMVTVLLALPAFLATGAARVFALALAGIALLIAFGHNSPVYGFLYAHLPLFNKFRIPVMVLLLFQLAACLGTAWGWSTVLDGRAEKGERARPVDRLLMIAAALLAVALLAGVLGREGFRAAYQSMAMAAHPGYPAQAASIAYEGFIGDLARVSLIGLGGALAAWLAFTRRLDARVATGIAALLILFELWPVSGAVMKPVIGPAVPHRLDLGRDDVVDYLEHAGPRGTFRVLPLDPDQFQSNRYAGFGIASLGGYHAAKPRLFQEFYDAQLMDNLGWMRLLNIRFLVTNQALPQVPAWLTLVHQGEGGFVYESHLALPRATLVDHYRVVQPAKAILDSVKNGTSDAEFVTFLESDPHLALGPASSGSAAIVSYRLNDLAIDVNAPAPGLLRVADLWFPDWVATVDGHETLILKADYLLRAVSVPAGRHRVEFHYRPRAIRRGLWLSIASLLAALALIAAGLLRARRAPAAPVAAAPPGG